MSKISMYVMAHKPFAAPVSGIYVPLQVGSALHEDLGFIRDDTGDNISVKNPNYSELTGIYWAWKNDHDSDIVGICHYRRFFAGEDGTAVNAGFVEKILGSSDIVATPAKLPKTIYEDYCEAHNAADMDETRKAIEKLCPDYLEVYDEVMEGHLLYFANMMITRKNIFDDYCKWLFGILFEVEKNLDISGYDDYNKRVFGFISERLLCVWIKKKGLKVFNAHVVVAGDKIESKELIEAGIACINSGDYRGLTEKFDERRQKYAELFQDSSDTYGYLNFLYDIAQNAAKGGDRKSVIAFVAERYIRKNYYLEYMKCMFDILEALKPGCIILGEEHALYGTDLGCLKDAAPLAMPAQDLYYDLRSFDRALDISEPGQLKRCILVADDAILYEKTEKMAAGAGVKDLVFDVMFPEEGKDNSAKPWEFVPAGLLSDEEKSMIEGACRNMSLGKGGFFNDVNPRGRDLGNKKTDAFDIEKKDPEIKQIFDDNVNLLGELAKSCEEKNIRFTVVTPPVKNDDNSRGRELRAELLSVLEELPYPVEYQDLNSEIWDGIFFEEDFHDGELLSAAGATKFTQILNELGEI